MSWCVDSEFRGSADELATAQSNLAQLKLNTTGYLARKVLESKAADAKEREETAYKESAISMIQSAADGSLPQVQHMVEQELQEHVLSGGDRATFVSKLVNRPDTDGRVPLHYASCYGHRAVAEVLLGAGADATASDSDGFTSLHFACRWDRLEVADYLVWLKTIVIDARDRWGQTPLHLAAAAGHTKLVDLLLWKGANLDAVDEKGRRPRDLAEAAHNNEEAAHHLRHHDEGFPSEATREARGAAAAVEIEEYSHPDYEFLGETGGEGLIAVSFVCVAVSLFFVWPRAVFPDARADCCRDPRRRDRAACCRRGPARAFRAGGTLGRDVRRRGRRGRAARGRRGPPV